jgi:hypothetical protein
MKFDHRYPELNYIGDNARKRLRRLIMATDGNNMDKRDEVMEMMAETLRRIADENDDGCAHCLAKETFAHYRSYKEGK